MVLCEAWFLHLRTKAIYATTSLNKTMLYNLIILYHLIILLTIFTVLQILTMIKHVSFLIHILILSTYLSICLRVLVRITLCLEIFHLQGSSEELSNTPKITVVIISVRIHVFCTEKLSHRG